MKTVLITGCNGFIGKRLVVSFITKNFYVVGADIHEKPLPELINKNFEYKQINFKNIVIEDFINFNFDLAYHLAWCGVSSNDKNDVTKQIQNVEITKNFLQLCRTIGVKHLLITGSMSEFSKYNNPVSGNELDCPSDFYSATKCYIRKMAFLFCEQYNINLNYFLITSVYGSNRKDSNLITSVIKGLKDGHIVKTTKLEQLWDYIFIDDLIEALVIVGLKGKANQIYPIGSGEVKPLSYYVNYISSCLNKRNLVEIGSIPYKNIYIDNSIPNTRELFDLGFRPKYNFEYYISSILEDKLNGQ